MGKLKSKKYQALLAPLQLELEAMERWVAATGARVLVLLEGRDAAGKGGTINTITRDFNPRQYRIVALPKPDDTEQGQWYFQRYLAHLPTAGELVLFDRSWYNRAGVESVMGFVTEDQVQAFLDQVAIVEKLLTDDGIMLFKYWLTCDQAQQEERFAERLADPLKCWKLSPIDLAAREKYQAYTAARDTMLKASHTKHAPWTLVDYNDQRRGRLTLIRDLLDRLPDTWIEPTAIELPPLGAEPAKENYSKLKPIKSFKG